MLLSHKYKFIFIHIPKNGGTSIKAALSPYADKEYEMPYKHRKSKYWRDHLKCWNEYFKFVFVRNPWDRMISKRFYQLYIQPDPECRKVGWDCKNLEDFFELDRTKHIINQCDYFYDGDKCMVDFVGKYENFQEDFNIVCDRIGIGRIVLPHLNSSPRGSYQEYYNETTKEIVDKACHNDIIRYGYKF